MIIADVETYVVAREPTRGANTDTAPVLFAAAKIYAAFAIDAALRVFFFAA